jgi:hypothetical protein
VKLAQSAEAATAAGLSDAADRLSDLAPEVAGRLAEERAAFPDASARVEMTIGGTKR